MFDTPVVVEFVKKREGKDQNMMPVRLGVRKVIYTQQIDKQVYGSSDFCSISGSAANS